MFYTCPACGKRSIFFLTMWVGGGGDEPNTFRCTACNATLSWGFSTLTVFMCSGLLSFFLVALATGEISFPLILGSALLLTVLFSLPVPIRVVTTGTVDNVDTAISMRAPNSVDPIDDDGSWSWWAEVRRFNNPWDQGWFHVEKTVLAIVVFITGWGQGLRIFVGWFKPTGNLAGDMWIFAPTFAFALACSFAYISAIYRIGRSHTLLRLLVDIGVAMLMIVTVRMYMR